jgi:hypothetical protein
MTETLAQDGSARGRAKSPAPRMDLDALGRELYREWHFGSHALAGWTPVAGGIDALIVPTIELFAAADRHRRIFHGDRLLGAATFHDVAAALEAEPVFLPLEEALATAAPMNLKHRIEPVIRPYVVSKTRERACFLLDIAQFSLFQPEEQAAQLSLLAYSLNIAAEKAHRQGIAVDLSRSNTGDGFYVWNRKKGSGADTDLFCVLMLALAHHALQQRRVAHPFSPTIRSCFSVGSHYSYHHLDHASRMENDYIVGDLTIELARLIEHAEANQILIGDFIRHSDETGAPVEAPAFMEAVADSLAALAGIELDDLRIERIAAYLTGGQRGDNFQARRVAIRDKHNLEHHAFNAKVNLFFAGQDPIYLGLRDIDVPERLFETG